MQNDREASVEETDFYILVPGNGQAPMTPPPPPPEYEPISAIQIVSSAELSAYWACLAYQQKHGIYGLLLYRQRDNIHTFYPTENAHHLRWLYGAPWGLGFCVPEFQDKLSNNGLWWNKQSVCVDQHSQAQGEEVQHAME